jgi:hypothetical protein
MAVKGAARVNRDASKSHRGGGRAGKRNWFQEKESAPPERRLGFTGEFGVAASSDDAGSQLFALIGDVNLLFFPISRPYL